MSEPDVCVMCGLELWGEHDCPAGVWLPIDSTLEDAQ